MKRKSASIDRRSRIARSSTNPTTARAPFRDPSDLPHWVPEVDKDSYWHALHALRQSGLSDEQILELRTYLNARRLAPARAGIMRAAKIEWPKWPIKIPRLSALQRRYMEEVLAM